MNSRSNEQLQQQLEYTLLMPDCQSWWISKMQSGREDTLEEWYTIKLCFKLWKMPQKQRMECFRLLFDHLVWTEHQFLSGIRDSRKAGSLWLMMRSVGWVRKSIYQSWLVKGLGSGLLCWGFKGFREEIRSEEASTLQIGSAAISTMTMHQSTTLSLSKSIWPRWASRQFPSLPIVQTLLPVTFGYSLSSKPIVMRELRRWKRLWRRSLTRSDKMSRSCWNSTTSALQPEEITSKGTRVSCVYTKQHLIMNLHFSKFEEWEVPFHCHYF